MCLFVWIGRICLKNGYAFLFVLKIQLIMMGNCCFKYFLQILSMVKCCVMSGDTSQNNLCGKLTDSEYYLIEEGDSSTSKSIR